MEENSALNELMTNNNIDMKDLDYAIGRAINDSVLDDVEITELLTALSNPNEEEQTEEEKIRLNKILDLEQKLGFLNKSLRNINDDELSYLEESVNNLLNYILNNSDVKKDYDYHNTLRKLLKQGDN